METETPVSNTCRDCGALGRLETLVLNDKQYQFTVFPCECQKRRDVQRAQAALEQERQAAARRYLKEFSAQVGQRMYAEATFDGFVRTEGNSAMLDAALGWNCMEHPRSLLLCGPSGTGKTRLALAAARREIIRHGIEVRFEPVSAMLRRLRGMYPSEQVLELEALKHSKVLILDDAGVLSVGERESLEDLLLEIVDYRWRHDQPTIITTNVPVSEIHHVLGDRIASRITDSKWVNTSCILSPLPSGMGSSHTR